MDQRTKRQLMARLERDAQRICARFRLRYRVLEPERANVRRRYGVCFSDGTIRIRLRHASTGRPLKYSSLVSTLCHELAHLRHFNHGPRFQAFYTQILEWARREGIYRPGRAATRLEPGIVPPEPGPVVPTFAIARASASERAGAAGGRVAARAGGPRPIDPVGSTPTAAAGSVAPAQLELFG